MKYADISVGAVTFCCHPGVKTRAPQQVRDLRPATSAGFTPRNKCGTCAWSDDPRRIVFLTKAEILPSGQNDTAMFIDSPHNQ